MATLNKIWRLIVGKPLDPLDPGTRHAIAVTPLLAWVGLGEQRDRKSTRLNSSHS